MFICLFMSIVTLYFQDSQAKHLAEEGPHYFCNALSECCSPVCFISIYSVLHPAVEMIGL